MRKTFLFVTLTIVFCFSILPLSAVATSWEDRLDEAHQAGFESGYEAGYADGYNAAENDFEEYQQNYGEKTETRDISKLIRQAQADAMRNLGGIAANDADAIMEESKRILREEYGINMDSVSSTASECPEDHEAIAEAARNKGRIEAAVACAVLFTLYAFLLRRK